MHIMIPSSFKVFVEFRSSFLDYKIQDAPNLTFLNILRLHFSSKVSVAMVAIEWALETRPLICRGMFPGIISCDASRVNSPWTLIWTTAIILFNPPPRRLDDTVWL